MKNSNKKLMGMWSGFKQETQSQVSSRRRVKHFLTVFLTSLVVVSGVLLSIYHLDIRTEEIILDNKLEDQMFIETTIISNYYESVMSDFMFLSNMVELRKMFSDVKSDGAKEDLIEEFLVFCKAKTYYDQIRILNETGMEIVRVNCNNGKPYIVSEEQLQSKAEYYYFKDTLSLEQGEIYISPFDLNVEGGEIEQPVKPTIRFGTPVFDNNGLKQGVIILNYLGIKLIRDFKSVYDDSLGHIMLVDPDGFWLIGMNPENEWGFMYEDRGNKTIGNTHPEAWQRISGAESGHFHNENGMFTFATIYPRLEVLKAAAGSDKALESSAKSFDTKKYYWKIISHVLPDKLSTGLRKIQRRFFQIYAFLIVLLAIGSWYLALFSVSRKQAEEVLKTRARQQETAAKFGQRALTGVGLATLMDEVVTSVVKTIKVDYCKILELLPDGNTLLLRAGVGWKEGLVGHAKVSAGTNSQAGYTLLSSEPVIVKDLSTESRFSGPLLLHDHQVVSGMSVVIYGKDKPFGVLGAHTTRRRTFTKDDVYFLQSIANVLAEAIERKQAEENLTSEKERLAVTLRSIGDGVIATDLNGSIVLINRAAEKLTGWTQERAIGKPLAEVFHIINEKTRELCENPVEKVLKTDEIVGLAKDTTIVSRNGRERVISSTGAPIHDKDSKLIGVILVFRDITKIKKMEEEFLKNRNLESIGILAGGIAHDFNNFLTGILGNISLAKMFVNPEDKVFKRLTQAEKASIQAQDLTQQLLTFSRGGAPIKKTASISELLKDSAGFALRGSNVRCDLSIPDDLWPVEIDEGQISQVIHNLIVNADQAMPKGGTIFVRAGNTTIGEQAHLSVKKGKYVKIAIKDQGVGISKEYLQKIFEPYFTTKQKGSGLGLATSFSIIKKHDGYMTVKSELGVGTIFYIYLLASEKEITYEKRMEREAVSGKGRILVMDDEEAIREFAGEVLKHLGYVIDFARDGAEAIELYKRAKEAGQPFAAVIMDLTIPGGMGGKEAIKRLLEIDREIKAIVSSGYSNDPIMSDFRKYGFSSVITKPYTTEDLSSVVNQVITE